MMKSVYGTQRLSLEPCKLGVLFECLDGDGNGEVGLTRNTRSISITLTR